MEPGKFEVKRPAEIDRQPVEELIKKYAEQRPHDAWLAEMCNKELEEKTNWHTTVAAGMLARLSEFDPKETPKESMDKFFRGEVDEVLAAPRRWAKSLSPEQVNTIKGLAVAESDLMHDDLDNLIETKVEDPHFKEFLLDICQKRDRLEGVRVLLREAGVGDQFDPVLFPLDRAAIDFVKSVPQQALQDEELRRVARGDHDAWWVKHLDIEWANRVALEKQEKK